jgi:glycosyltransferase involved in cell wall biosynthesis
MLVTCICVCHNKPDLTPEAIGSIVGQSYPNWEALVVDSGVLYDQGYYQQFPWRTDARVRLLRSGETAETRRTKAMAPWCFNECFRRGLVRGELVVYLCDDDVFYPHAFETFVGFARRHPEAHALYASEDVGVIYPNGWHAIVGERRASERGGRSCDGRPMDCHVDYLQFCHKTDVLKLFREDEYWPEAKATEEHADGLFMERVGAHVTIHPIDVKVGQNRRTPRSTYTPLSPLQLLDSMANGAPLLPGRTGAMTDAATNVKGDPLVTISVCSGDAEALPHALASVAAQTYAPLEVLVLDASPGEHAPAAFEAMGVRYPGYRFLRQPGARVAAARNRGLTEARGSYFLSMDASHIARPEMIEHLLALFRDNSRLSAVTCYLLVHRAGAPAPMVSAKNVHGHALFRTADFRAVGGYDTGAEESGNDWSAFFRLVNAGRHVDVVPEHLFSCSATGEGAEQLQPFFALDRALAGEREAVWAALAGYERRLDELAAENQHLRARLELLRYRVADRLDALCARVPVVRRGMKRLAAVLGAARSPARRPEDGG